MTDLRWHHLGIMTVNERAFPGVFNTNNWLFFRGWTWYSKRVGICIDLDAFSAEMYIRDENVDESVEWRQDIPTNWIFV